MANQIKKLYVRLLKTKDSLLKIPAFHLIYLTARGLDDHDTTQRAAGVAYYAILSTFPLLLGLIAVFGYFLPSLNLQEELLIFVGKNLPGATDFLKQNIVSVVKLRGPVGVLSIVLLFWSASGMFGAIAQAINRAWDNRRGRRFYIGKAHEVGMALGTGILFLSSLGASTLISISGEIFDLPPTFIVLVEVGSRLAAFLLLLAVFLLLYKFIPNVKTHWRYVWPGALLAAILFEIARTLFILYLEKYANYQLIYGSIASIIILLVWIYYSAFIMILGAEFTFQYSRLRNSAATESADGK
ncbi:MAG: YihY/virulence factor BrkB family protein [Candidatus Edwardsbacteria bacterium]|nr:YihY/virulence factor BrkB family protein [Candidatus Edwardsbacteria bacterium]